VPVDSVGPGRTRVRPGPTLSTGTDGSASAGQLSVRSPPGEHGLARRALPPDLGDHHRELVRQDLRLRAYLDQRFTAPDGDQQRRQKLIDDWVASLRRRTPVINLYRQ